MKGNQSQAISRMWAAGLSAQSSVYGQTIPVFYGTTRAAGLLTIWMQELRKGSSGKKAKKKGQQTYVENVDFLVGHNPIASWLQVWHDADTKIPLAFSSQTFASVGGFSITVSDPNFYAVLAVTYVSNYSTTFNDYGSQGPNSVSGTYELPLWNERYVGPDATNQSAIRWAPFVYDWVPGSGNVISLPFNGSDGPWGGIWPPTLKVYYAALDPSGFKSTGKFKNEGSIVPISALRLQFEDQLGNGNEYSTPGNFTADQIIYPMYSGAGSNSLDLGTSGSIPVIRPEILGSFPINAPRGDADFMDMVEDIFKSGPAQNSLGAPTAYGEIHHGLGCLDYPGTINENWNNRLLSSSWGSPGFPVQNNPGNFLVTIYKDIGNTGTSGANDTLGDSFTQVSGDSVYYTQTTGGFPNQIDILGRGGNLSGGNNCQQMIFEIGGLDTLESVTKFSGGSDVSFDVTTAQDSGAPAYILVAVRANPAGGFTQSPSIPQWKKLLRGPATIWADQRTVMHPGTYHYSAPFPGSSWDAYAFVFKNSQPVPFPNPLPNILDDGPTGTMQLTRNQCRAYGLIGSLEMDSQKPAKDWLDDIFFAADAAPVWSGFSLKVIPRSEQSFAGNGVIYTSPTASGPVENLTEADFIAGPNEPPVSIERKARIDPPNLQQLQHPNRDSDYNEIITAQPDNGAISFYGTRKDAPKVLRCIQDATRARMILGLQIRRDNYILNTYKFKANARWKLLEPMDLITIPVSSTVPTTPGQPPSGTIPLRITSVSEDENFQLDIEAEPFVYPLNAPIALDVTAPSPYVPAIGADPGPVNSPVIFLATPELNSGVAGSWIWIGLSGSDPTLWGGAQVFVSTDGTTYPDQPLAQQVGATNMGVVANSPSWPLTVDPDTTADLLVDLTESLGTLNSQTVTNEDNGVSACYVEGGTTPIPYEMMTYAIATLTSANKYTLSASSGNHLRRGFFGTPISAHPTGSKFAYMGAGATFTKLLVDPTWYGKTIYFKFPSFNVFGSGLESLSGLTAYPFTIPFPVSGDVNAEIPAGAIDGSNAVFTLSLVPDPTASLEVYLNGVKQPPSAYSLSGADVTMGAAPSVGDSLYVYYRIDGLSAPYIWDETPTGTIDGINVTFTLASTPNPSASLKLWLNGVLIKQGLDYTLSTATITMTTAPVSGDVLEASYRVDGSVAADSEVPTGSGTAFSLAHVPDPPLSLLLYRNGIEQIPGSDYTLSGAAITLTTTIGSDSLLAFYEF